MKRTLLASALMLATASAAAADFNYSYAEIGFGELDRFDADALYFGGAVDLQQGFGLIGSYYAVDGDRNWDGDILTFGGQFHGEINKQTDFVASVQLVHAEWEWDCWGRRGGCDDDDTGVLLRAGVRHAIQSNLHLEGDVTYNTNDFWDDDELGLRAGVRFYLDRQFSIAGGIAADQEFDGLFISGRYDFR